MITGLVLILLGLGLVIFRNPFSSLIIKQQNKTWKFNFGETEKDINVVIVTLVGLGWILMGFLYIFKT